MRVSLCQYPAQAFQSSKGDWTMSRNDLLAVIAVLAICTVGISFHFYRKRHHAIEIQIGEQGLTIDGN